VGRFYASDGRGGLSPRADHAAYSFASEWTHLVAARLAPGGYTDFLFYKRSSGIIEIWNVLEGSLARLQSRPHVRLTLEPKRIERGGQATLTWTTREASTVDLQPFPGPDRAGGQTAVRPERTTTYRLVATNEGGMSRAEATLVVEGTEEQEAPRPSPETTPGTLQGSYVRDLLGTQPSSIRVVLQGRWISGSGVEGRTSFTEERPGQIGPGPASVFPFTITNLRRGRWSITASSDLSPPLTCETSIPPGLITFRFGPQGGSCG
jgi:hypothetical protein